MLLVCELLFWLMIWEKLQEGFWLMQAQGKMSQTQRCVICLPCSSNRWGWPRWPRSRASGARPPGTSCPSWRSPRSPECAEAASPCPAPIGPAAASRPPRPRSAAPTSASCSGWCACSTPARSACLSGCRCSAARTQKGSKARSPPKTSSAA